MRNKTEILIVNKKLLFMQSSNVVGFGVVFFFAEFKSLENLGRQGFPENTIIVTSVPVTVFWDENDSTEVPHPLRPCV